MALAAAITGTVENQDLYQMIFTRDSGTGTLVGSVTYKVTIGGIVQTRTAEWALTPAEVQAVVANHLESAKQAIRDAEGVS